MTSKRVVWIATILLATVVGCSHNDKNYVVLDDESTNAEGASIQVADQGNAAASSVASVVEKPVEAPVQAKDANKSSVVPKFDEKGVSVDLTGVAFDGVDDTKELERWLKIKVVRGSGVLTPKALQTFAKLQNLTEFLWQGALVSDDAKDSFVALANLPKLKKVRLTGLRYVDRDEFPPFALALSATANLEDLDISGSAITSDALTALNYDAGFKKLTRLNLYHTKIGDAGVKSVLPLKDRLTWFNVDDAGITPESASYLAQFAKLTFLHVGRSALDDSCVESLAQLTELKKIHVTRCGITEEGADKLRQALPNCEVVSQPEK